MLQGLRLEKLTNVLEAWKVVMVETIQYKFAIVKSRVYSVTAPENKKPIMILNSLLVDYPK